MQIRTYRTRCGRTPWNWLRRGFLLEDFSGRPLSGRRLISKVQIMKKIAVSIALLAVLALPLTGQEPQKDISKAYKDACDRLICQCGCNEQLSVCAMQNCSSATPMRAEVRERLLKGDSIDAIVDSFVARYGKKVLSAPTMHGFDITAWIMPFLIFGLGTVVVSWIVVRMVRPSTAPQAAPAPVDPRVDREFKDFEEES
jgi:cytochrome c-type biogenesis protein CcmH/NrfF